MAQGISHEAVAALLQERWGEHLQQDERFFASVGEAEGQGAKVCLGLEDADGSTRTEFEVVAPRQAGGRNAVDVALDAADALLGEWLEADRPRPTGHTAPRIWEGIEVQVTVRRLHPRLEAEADRLLGEGDEGGGLDA